MDAQTRGERAARILEDEVYGDAVNGAKHRIKDKWGATDDPAQRDALWHQLQAIEAVTRELKIIRDNGIVERRKHEKESERE